MFLLELKEEVRKKYVLVVLGALFIATGALTKYFSRGNEFIQGFQISQRVAIIVFVGMLFISYEMFSNLQKKDFVENLKIHKGGLAKYVAVKHVMVLIAVGAIFLLVFLMDDIALNHVGLQEELFVMFMKVLVLNFLLCPLVGVFVGKCFAYLFRRKWGGYFAVLIVAILVCRLFYAVNIAMYELLGVNLDGIYRFFQLEQPNDTWVVDYQYLVPAESYRFYIYLTWILASQAIILLMKRPIARKKVSLILGAVCVIFCINSMKNVITAGNYLNYDLNVRTASNKSAEFQDTVECEEEAADFTVEKYEITPYFSADSYTFGAETTVYLGEEEVEEYKFTLYRGFDWVYIYDENRKKVEYTREGDYITVKTDGKVSQLTFEYDGWNPSFYAMSGAVYLPGYFAYYPQAGFRSVFINSKDEDGNLQMGYNTSEELLQETEFEIGFLEDGQIEYTNLDAVSQEEIDNGDIDEFPANYKGVTNLPTLIGGNVTETQIDGYRVVYQSLVEKTLGFNFSPDELMDALEARCDETGVDILKNHSIDTIVFVPKSAEISDMWATSNICGNILYLGVENMYLEEEADTLAEEIIETYVESREAANE
ncbi:hypothetical protein [Eubacterium oxidoreducens]|nr:hypothetical protein [Eubacterium oxidoreducens]